MKKNYKKVILILFLIFFLALLLVYATKYFTGKSGVEDVVYTLELEDLPHFQKHETIKIHELQFTVKDVVEVEKDKLWKINTDIEDLKEFDGNYTFFLANKDILIVGSSSYEKNGELYICNSPDNKNSLNQLCLLQNGTMESLLVINLD